MRQLIVVSVLLLVAFTANADYPERCDVARREGKTMVVKEWKTTPDGRKEWVDHAEVYDAEGRLIEEAEYSDFGSRLAWRATFEYNDKGQLVVERIYNERNKLDKYRKYEYNEAGVCVRRLNYSADGKLNSYRRFEFIFE